MAERVGLSRFAGSASLVLRTFTTALPRWQSNGVLHPTEKSRLFAALKIGGEGGIIPLRGLSEIGFALTTPSPRKASERVGFEPTERFRSAVFKTADVR